MSKHDKETSDTGIINDFFEDDTIDSSDNENETYVNRCIICDEDLGLLNPRQYCCKTHCPYEGLTKEEIKEIKTPKKRTKQKNIPPKRKRKRKGISLMSKFDKIPKIE